MRRLVYSSCLLATLLPAVYGQGIAQHLLSPGQYSYPANQINFILRSYSTAQNNDAPSSSDTAFWTAQLNNTGPTPDPIAAFLKTLLVNSAFDNAHWALALYQTMLYRDPEPIAYANVLQALNQGWLTRAQLVDNVLTSWEWRVYAHPQLEKFAPLGHEIMPPTGK